MTKLKTRTFATPVCKCFVKESLRLRGKIGKDAFLTAGVATNWRDAAGKKSVFFSNPPAFRDKCTVVVT